jgi:hypothetical protein
MANVALLVCARWQSIAQSPTCKPSGSTGRDASRRSRDTADRSEAGQHLKYKIGQGDVLIIRVFGHQELTRETPVTSAEQSNIDCRSW